MATVGHQICDVVDCLPRNKDAQDSRQECVLLVEDNEESMLLVRYALQEYGNGAYRLEWADGLTAAKHRLTKPGVDLIILDLGLPESTGPESYAAIRRAAPDLPVLILTGDTREQTECTIVATGVDDFLVKDEVSGALLIQAIRVALYSNHRWREHKNSAYKSSQRYHWASETCQALSALARRMLKLNRADSVLTCAKAIVAIVDHYTESTGSAIGGRADLLLNLERLASRAETSGNDELARRLRAMISPPPRSDATRREEFELAMRHRRDQLDHEEQNPETEGPIQDNEDLAQVLRQILASVNGSHE